MSAGLLALLSAGLLILGAGPASAHASLVDTDPAEGAVVATAPDKAVFTFDEHVTLPASAVHLFDATGKELSASASSSNVTVVVDLPGALADGTYVITWRVVSSDGHPIAGALTFSVGAPSEKVVGPNVSTGTSAMPTDVGVLQALQYIGLFAAVGLVWELGSLSSAPAASRKLSRIARVGAAIAWLASLLLVPERSLTNQGLDVTSFFEGDVWFTSIATHDWQVLGVLTVALPVLIWAAAHASRRPFAVGAGLVALASLVLVGHTRAVGPAVLVVASDLVHVVAGAIWLGGLGGIALVWRQLDAVSAARALARFSTVGGLILLALGVTGALMAWRILRSWDALVSTPFGVTLLIKLGVVAVVVALAATNRFALLPKVVRHPHAERARARLRSVVVWEASGLVGVLFVTGFLVQQSPVEDSSPAYGGLDSKTYTALSGDLRAYAVVEPAAVGPNTVVVQIQDVAGDPLEPYAEPTLTASLGDLKLGEQILTEADSGTYKAEVVFPRAGEWVLRVSVRTSEFDGPVVDVSVPVS